MAPIQSEKSFYAISDNNETRINIIQYAYETPDGIKMRESVCPRSRLTKYQFSVKTLVTLISSNL